MSKIVVLDSRPLSLLTNPKSTLETTECVAWLQVLSLAGHRVLVPEIIDYELRRELMRAGKYVSLGKLETLKTTAGYIPLTTAAMQQAAAFGACPTLKLSSLPAMSAISIALPMLRSGQIFRDMETKIQSETLDSNLQPSTNSGGAGVRRDYSSNSRKPKRFRLFLSLLCIVMLILIYPRLLGTLILRAAAHGKTSQVRLLLKAGANPDSYGWYIPMDQTPLMLAASNGSLPTVRILIARGADVNTGVNEWSCTPLMCAVEGGNPAIVRLLIAKGANLDSIDGSGDTALIIARANHHLEIAKMLKLAGAKEMPKANL